MYVGSTGCDLAGGGGDLWSAGLVSADVTVHLFPQPVCADD